jgi:predicted peptidase
MAHGTFITTRPQAFAAAVPVCGVGDPALAAEIVDVPVWAFHGRNDRNVPVRGSSVMIAAIRKAGGDPRYTEYPNEGHAIAHLAYKDSTLLDWMFGQQRK